MAGETERGCKVAGEREFEYLRRRQRRVTLREIEATKLFLSRCFQNLGHFLSPAGEKLTTQMAGVITQFVIFFSFIANKHELVGESM